MSLFGKKVAKSTPNEGGLYFLPGNYLVEIDTVKVITSRKDEDLFIVVAEVKDSDNDQRKPGCKPSWVVNMKQDPAPGNIKSFLAAIYGIDTEDLNGEGWESLYDDSVDEDNPLCGCKVNLNAANIKTKKDTDFTKHNWSFAYDDMDEMPDKSLEILTKAMEKME